MIRSLRRAVLLTGAIAALTVPAASSEARTKTVLEPSGTVRVGLGDALVIQYRVSGGVGIDWRLHYDSSPNVLRLLAVTERAENPDPRAIGGYSRKAYRFRARRRGTAYLTYVRDFRGDESRTYVRVRIR